VFAFAKSLRTVKRAAAAIAVTLLLAPLASLHSAETKTVTPNIVIIYIDDMGYADIGPFGAKGYATPHLDRMAAEGMKFTSFYSAQAVCSASRAALMTGCYANRVGIPGALGPHSKIGISDREMTIAQLCKQKNYATAIFGKWHLGDAPQFLPTRHGFDEYFGLPYSNDMWPRHPTAKFPPLPLIEQETVINPDVDDAVQNQLTTLYTQRAVSFIQRHKDRPFFLYVPHTMVHVPLHVSDKFRGKTPRGLFGDVVEEIDWSVGQILDALKTNGLDGNTLVMFCSDNGPWLCYGDHAGSAYPLREGKGTSWDGGVREPTLMRWPGHIPAGKVCDAPLMTIDMLPTIARLIGGRLPGHKIDGLDISEVILGKSADSPHEVLYFYYNVNDLEALRSGKWKLELPRHYVSLNGRPGGHGGMPAKYDTLAVGAPELYDLDADPGQKHNLAGRRREVLARLLAYAEKAREELGDGLTRHPGTQRREPGRLPQEGSQNKLRRDFIAPPDAFKAWCYWWWLNGAASKEGITRDFEEMKKQGIAGALLFDAGEGGADAPRGPPFMGPQWRELYRHALREADRCGIALSVNLCSGWNAGGPWVTPQHAAKKLVAASVAVKGPAHESLDLPQPEKVQGFYRDIAVLAQPQRDPRTGGPRAAWDRSQTVDLTSSVDAHGRLTWDVPAGTWTVLRIGYTLHGNATKFVGSGPAGLEIDTMSRAAMDAHFAETGAKLIADAGPLAGKTLQYFHIDSWELGQPTWTPLMRSEFQKRRGYDLLSYLPALLGQTVTDPLTTQRFLADYRRTAADLVAVNYYGRFRELTIQGGLRGTHPESGGPFFEHWIDALQCEGVNDIPMGEFWKRNAEPGGSINWPPETNPTVKQIASAAHIYGKPICQAEAYTSFACDWIDDPWTMKDIGDAAFCHGLTRQVLCFWVHQPRVDAGPGSQWAHVGTHFGPTVTWWPMSHAWLTYLARCQLLLGQGRFVADFAYLQSEEIPGFIAPRDKQQPPRPAGFDYDVLNTEVLLSRAAVRNGRLVLPDGMTYRYLVLPDRSPLAISPRVLGKIAELAQSGATVIGGKPSRAPGLTNFPKCDSEVQGMGDALWGAGAAPVGGHKFGAGRVIWGRSLDEVVKADRLSPDIEFRGGAAAGRLDWIHRRDGETEIYFVANLASAATTVDAVFRSAGKQPELWDAVTGEVRDLTDWRPENGRTVVPLAFAPRQSWFIVFRNAAVPGSAAPIANFPPLQSVQQIDGPWQVSFDPKWGGPSQVTFPSLQDWTTRSEPGIRYYSGTAVYRKQLEIASPGPAGRLFLDLGAVKNVARVKLNGRDLGVIWTSPWRVEITGALRPGVNDLEIELANLWPNRLIGDGMLSKDKRLTLTNVKTYETRLPSNEQYPTYGCPICDARRRSGGSPVLLSSGLLGPVTLQATKAVARGFSL